MNAPTIFQHGGRTYVEMNGKTFQALRLFNGGRGYGSALDSITFALLFGKAPLTPADLPDPKKYSMLRTKTGGAVGFSLWRKDRFEYDTDAASAKWAFFAPTHAGAWYLALRHLVKRLNLAGIISDPAITDMARQIARGDHKRPLGYGYAEDLADIAGGAAGVQVNWVVPESYLTSLFNVTKDEEDDDNASESA